jgi:drug/metabolite transporter (DMT)-like permease
MTHVRIHPPVAAALAAAVLFGASTPLAKPLVGEQSPLLVAGLLYLGSGIGLAIVRLVRDRGWASTQVLPGEWHWLIAAIAFGGVLGPALLMTGLRETAAGTASLMLNLEAVLTAVLAWIVFRENTERRIVLGMALIVAGGIALAWPGSDSGSSNVAGPLAIVAACLCWAIDNNLTRKVSAADAVFVAATKGLAAGTVNVILALAANAPRPSPGAVAAAGAIGFLGYGVSVVLFVIALRGLGSARTGAYFSTAAFIGAAIAIGLFREPATATFWIAASLMAVGVWLHLTERHEHEHTHEALLHSHPHVHDDHHRHEHDFPWNGREPHTHLHRHAPLTHSHPHFPDIHHRHDHR